MVCATSPPSGIVDLNDSRQAPKAQQRRWGGAVVIVIVFLLVFAGLTTMHSNGSYNAAFERGMVGLSNATKDEASYEAAIEELRSGATLGVFDHYPVFVLQAAELMRDGSDNVEHATYYNALAARKFDDAKRYAKGLENKKLAEFMNRLADDLAQR